MDDFRCWKGDLTLLGRKICLGKVESCFSSHILFPTRADWHPLGFVCLATERFPLLLEILSTNVTLNVFSPRLLLQSLGFEGRDLTKENKGT